MRLARILITALVVVALLSTLILSAYAEGQGYGRWNNPGKGHDWAWYEGDPYVNSNINDNEEHNENGYLNHLPHDEGGGGSPY